MLANEKEAATCLRFFEDSTPVESTVYLVRSYHIYSTFSPQVCRQSPSSVAPADSTTTTAILHTMTSRRKNAIESPCEINISGDHFVSATTFPIHIITLSLPPFIPVSSSAPAITSTVSSLAVHTGSRPTPALHFVTLRRLRHLHLAIEHLSAFPSDPSVPAHYSSCRLESPCINFNLKAATRYKVRSSCYGFGPLQELRRTKLASLSAPHRPPPPSAQPPLYCHHPWHHGG